MRAGLCSKQEPPVVDKRCPPITRVLVVLATCNSGAVGLGSTRGIREALACALDLVVTGIEILLASNDHD